MSTPNKLRGDRSGRVPVLTRLKDLALKKRDVRDQLWEWRNEPGLTNAAIRGRIEASYGITVSRDGQLSEFWSWLRHLLRAENWNARMEQFEEWMRKQNPNATVEQIRDAGIAFFMTETVADQDREGFVEVANLDLKKRGMETKARFEERKVTVSERKLALLEAKAKQADEAREVVGSALSAEEKAQRMKQIFGMS